jgi:hypothetical protein
MSFGKFVKIAVAYAAVQIVLALVYVAILIYVT